ncbi:hypothetical protein [Metabacillus sp. Hm71]|uniref:hypothetical protein n=1 Tax=Metabacillus sp. Hm71 TaxID=3450743 RepID=UPI003F42C3C2
MGWKDHKGIYKQYLMRSLREPSAEAKQRAEDMILDEDVLRVFVDASELKSQGIFGLGLCFVGQGSVIVKSKKLYNQSMKKQIIFAELSAIEFALEQISILYKEKDNTLPEIIIYSDITLVEQLSGTSAITKNQEINLKANRVRNLWEAFLEFQPGIKLQIKNMKQEMKKFNPYYKAAHNAARSVIGN